MLDPDLLDFSLGLPGNLKVHRGELRWLFKRATHELLPKEIIHKKKHGFGLPFGLWMRTDSRLTEIATESLRSLARRGWFRREFLEEALRMHRDGHAAYFGELIWILTALELWLQHHAPQASRAQG
jgi:asparagine synthase (glutamine-hydrolysing)